MTEKTLFLYTNGFTGDTGDGAAPYTEEEFRGYNHAILAGEVANAGVLSGVLNELLVSGSTSPLSVATGRAVLYGFHYTNLTAAASLTVTTPVVGDTGGRVVARINLTGANNPPAENNGRLLVILSADGTATIPAMIQTAATTWDIPLATFVIDTSGNIWTDSAKTVAGVSDARYFAISPLAGMVRLRETVVGVAAGSISWKYIQPNLNHLLIVGQARGTNATTSAGINVRFNGDTGANYRLFTFNGLNASYPASDNVIAAGTGPHTSLPGFSSMTAASGTANIADAVHIEIPNYARTTFYKTARSQAMSYANGGTASVMNIQNGWWLNTAAINRVDLISGVGNFEVGSVLTLYGMR